MVTSSRTSAIQPRSNPVKINMSHPTVNVIWSVIHYVIRKLYQHKRHPAFSVLLWVRDTKPPSLPSVHINTFRPTASFLHFFLFNPIPAVTSQISFPLLTFLLLLVVTKARMGISTPELTALYRNINVFLRISCLAETWGPSAVAVCALPTHASFARCHQMCSTTYCFRLSYRCIGELSGLLVLQSYRAE